MDAVWMLLLSSCRLQCFETVSQALDPKKHARASVAVVYVEKSKQFETYVYLFPKGRKHEDKQEQARAARPLELQDQKREHDASQYSNSRHPKWPHNKKMCVPKKSKQQGETEQVDVSTYMPPSMSPGFPARKRKKRHPEKLVSCQPPPPPLPPARGWYDLRGR